MSDERILGDSEFVDRVLSRAGEKYERRYELKRQGYDLDRIAERVAEIYGMETREIMSRRKQPILFLGGQRVGHVDQASGQEAGNESSWSGFSGRKGEGHYR